MKIKRITEERNADGALRYLEFLTEDMKEYSVFVINMTVDAKRKVPAGRYGMGYYDITATPIGQEILALAHAHIKGEVA